MSRVENRLARKERRAGRRGAASFVSTLLLPLALLGSGAPADPRAKPLGAAPAPSSARQVPIRITGQAVPEMESFDRVVSALMTKWAIPGGSVAVVKEGRLLYARGFGWADREKRQPVEPESLFRIASLSKSITATAILKLAEDGKLRLEDEAFRWLKDLEPRPGARVHPELASITILQLLQHSGGWDRDKSFDPMFLSPQIIRTLWVPAPASAEAVVRYMLDQPLQFKPGTQYAYSNFGYCVLGRIVERASGQRYEDYVRSHILRPAGVTAMRLGRTLPEGRAPREVRYYDFEGHGHADSVFPVKQRRVPWPYGGWSIEAMDAHGGWIASTVDMARFVTAIDGRGHGPRILRPASIERMVARPAPPLWPKGDTWYGMGWQVRPVEGGQNWWHMGSLDGTTTLMVRAANGLTWVVFFNYRPEDSDALGSELDAAMWQAVAGVKSWPSHDLFPRFAGRGGGR